MISILITIVVFLIIIGIAINFHELGHFITAKLFVIRVEEFSFGFGPKIFSQEYKGTNYMIKLFPIGGYVSILGEEKRLKRKDSFSEKSFGIKILVAIGGIVMNFLLSVIIFYAVLINQNFVYSGFPYYSDMNLVFGEQYKAYAYPPLVLEVQEDGGADKSGLEEYYQIVRVEGEDVESAKELKTILESNKSSIVEVGFIDDEGSSGSTSIQVNSEGKIGISHADDFEILKVEYVGVQKYFSGFLHSANMVQANAFLIGKVIQQSIAEKDVQPVAEAISGPVGLLAITDAVRRFGGFWGILELMGVLSIALMITNLIPFPGLDGSHVLILIVEKIRGKPIDDKVKGWIFGVGMVLLFTMAFMVAIKDVVQFGIWGWIKGLFN